MRILVIGFGQCGSNIADQFARINRRARIWRGIEIVTGAYAVNTDVADLSGLSHIKSDFHHRILIGGRKAGGHGVGKINELGAELARDDADKIIEAIRTTPHFHQSDAFMLIAGAAGGTGSGAIPVLTPLIRKRFLNKPVYNLIVLPFEHEEYTEERAIYNSATCLKSASAVADAIFLVDNERYAKKDSALRNNLAQINALIVEPFYNILCAGEETKAKYLGSRLLDAGDIMQTIAGWTTAGHGRSRLPVFRLPFRTSRSFREKDSQVHRGTEAMDQAISELSIDCEPEDAAKALYLTTAPAKEMNLTLIKEVGEYLKNLAPQSIIRNGDYPRGKGAVAVSVILSELKYVEKVKRYYDDASRVVSTMKRRQKQTKTKLEEIDGSAQDFPSLS